MSSKKLVIVESPTKARTIRKFLGKDYTVESCMGHIRDLPESSKEIPESYKKYKWSKLGVNVEEGFEPIYCIPSSKAKIISLLKKKAKESGEIILATDEDREGESISWHLQEILKKKKSKVSFKRMVFHEITQSAITKALKDFRSVNMDLVYAQEGRRILDRLVGYRLSPVLWKNIARGLSAGRVQSAAVKLLSERELKRIEFKKSKYMSIQALFSKNKKDFPAFLSEYDDRAIADGSDFDRDTGKFVKTKKLLLDQKTSKKIITQLKKGVFKVLEIKKQSVSKKPSPPFTTSTLQQEANRKLSMSSKNTMSLAQKLYENGLITYMRTDSVFLSKQAVSAARADIQKHYGKKHLPESPRFYKNKSKGAQEAHEAIRPAGSRFVHPKNSKLDGPLLKLYELIWMRTLASQAVDCLQEKVSVKIQSSSKALFQASGMTILSPGFYKIDKYIQAQEKFLPELKKGMDLKLQKMEGEEHETKPPARFTEASLVQLLEKEGIGRPSTYAPIIATIQKRGYVFKDKNALVPTMTALIVTRFLSEYFPDYVDSSFTSSMEQVLDDIAEGKKNHTQYLKQVYFGKNGLKNQIQKQSKHEAKNHRSLKIKGLEGFTFFAGPYGAYVVLDSKKKEKISATLPQGTHPGDLTPSFLKSLIHKKSKGPESLGKDPKTGESIYVLHGRFGPYVQRGEIKEGKKQDVKRTSIPKGLSEEDIDLKMALDLLKLPETLCRHPKTSKDVKKGIGPFGPYIVHDGDFRSIRPISAFFKLTKKEALSILAQPKKKGRGSKKKAV